MLSRAPAIANREFSMKTFTYRTAVPLVVLSAVLSVATVNAQTGYPTPQGQDTGQAGGLGSLGKIGSALPGQSLTSGSTSNVAGLLEFCIKNNYLGGNDASSVKNKLMGKLPGGAASSDSGYTDGSKGLLKSSDGKQLDLSGGGIQAQVSKQVCDQVLNQAKSLL
jgi:hypothetical protein